VQGIGLSGCRERARPHTDPAPGRAATNAAAAAPAAPCKAAVRHDRPHPITKPNPKFDYERRVAELAFGDDADELGGLTAGGRDWMQLTDTEHCGKVAGGCVRVVAKQGDLTVGGDRV
jgi:hypothetical protein